MEHQEGTEAVSSPFAAPAPGPAPGEPYPTAPRPDGYVPTHPAGYVPVHSAPPRTVGADYLAWSGPAPFAFPGTEEVDPAEVFAGPGYTSPRPRTSTWARVAIIAAVLGVIPGISLVAVVTGHVALGETSRGRIAGRGMALAGLALGYIGVTLWLLFALVWAITL